MIVASNPERDFVEYQCTECGSTTRVYKEEKLFAELKNSNGEFQEETQHMCIECSPEPQYTTFELVEDEE